MIRKKRNLGVFLFFLLASFTLFCIGTTETATATEYTAASESGAIYGTGWGADSLGNIEVGKENGRKISYRFRAEKNGPVDKVLIYLIFRDLGYYSGNGGAIKMELQSDDGSAQHLPSGNTLTNGTVVDNAPMAGTQVTHIFNFPDPGPELVQGQLYHLVFSNPLVYNGDPATDPKTNWVSINCIYPARAKANVQPAKSDLDFAVLWIYGGSVSQNWEFNYNHTPIFCLFYQDASTQGQGYINAASQSGLTLLSGVNKVGETFTVSGGDQTINKVGIFLAKKYGENPGDLTVRLEESNGMLIEEVVIPSSQLPALIIGRNDTIGDWVSKQFLQSHILRNGNTYNVVLSAPVGDSYRVFPLDEGTGYGYRSGIFTDGYYQYNTGSGWQSRTGSDMQFYLGASGGTPVNEPPVLNPIGSKSIRKGSLLTFTISATDPNGDALTYTVANKPTDATFNASTRTFSWTPQAVGQYTVRFTVTDTDALSDYEDVPIAVTDIVNTPPGLNPIGNKQVSTGVYLAFNISATDPDGDTLTYSATGVPSGATFNPTSRDFTWTPTTAGIYTVRFSVSDGRGGSDYEDVVITVTAAVNQPPVANFNKTSPGAGPSPWTVSFDGTVSSDPDGSIAAYSWNFGDGGTSTVSRPSHTFINTTTSNKYYTVTLTVTDNNGATNSISDRVLVYPGVTNKPPVAVIKASTTSGRSPLTVSFNGTGSYDPDGTVVSGLWNFGDGTSSTAQKPIHIFRNTTTSTKYYTVTLTVKDNKGATGRTSKVITVYRGI